MRRGYVGRSDALVKSEQGEQGFWPSYADMMSAVALILFFLMLLSYTQNLITGNNLRNTQKTLSNTEETLSVTQQNLSNSQTELERAQLSLAEAQSELALKLREVENAEAELTRITGDLDEAQAALSLQQSTLEQQQAELSAQNAQLLQQQSELSAQAAQLEQQQALIAAQDQYVRDANEELLQMHNQMQSISVLRLSIVEQIRDSVAQVMGDSNSVSISDNGSIVLGDGVFFDVGKSEIKAEAMPTLNKLIDAFAVILSNEENVRYIDSIVISGHTDNTGENWQNRVLSTNRANAVLNYLLTNSGGKLAPYVQYFSAAGYGEERPIDGTDQSTDAGRAANRRIEISIILKDESILDIVDSYLRLEVPEIG